jgi:hypothetical protein
MALHRAGMGLRAIARELRISRKVVRRFAASPRFPERAEGTGQHHKRKSKLAPYLPYLRERWMVGAHNGSQLFREIEERGYTGSRSLLGRLLAQWRIELPRHSPTRETTKTALARPAGSASPLLS